MRRGIATFLLLLTLAVPSAAVHAQTITPNPLTASSASLTQEQRAVVIAQLQQLIVQLTQQLQAIIAAKAQQGSGGLAGAAACAISRTLALGMRGDDVKCLQRFLIAQNLLASDSATGYFGPLTNAAVIALQTSRGLEPVGHVGKLTRAIVNAAPAPQTPSTPAPQPPVTPPSSAGGGGAGGGSTPPPPPPVPSPDTSAPTVSLTAPTTGSTVSGVVAITATASDNVGVAGVQFKIDGANVGAEDTAAPYSVSWNTASTTNGTHTITAVARDGAGNRAMSTVNVTVSNPAAGNVLTITDGQRWYPMPYEAQITSITFDIEHIPQNRPMDACISMGPRVSPPEGYILYGMGGFTELMCLWTQHRATNDSSRHTTIDLSASPLYVPPGTALQCGVTNIPGLVHSCSITYKPYVPGSPRYRILRLPSIDHIMDAATPFIPSYWWRWDTQHPLHATGAVVYTSIETQGPATASVDTCVNVVHQGGAIVSSDCVPTQRTGPAIDANSVGLIRFDRIVTGTDLLTSTCVRGGSPKATDCVAYVIAEVPPATINEWRIPFFDYGQTAGLDNYCNARAAQVGLASDLLCLIPPLKPGCTTAEKVQACKSIFPVAPCVATGTCYGGTSPASCTFNGQSIPDSQSVTAYQSSSVPAGQQCASERRACANGTLSGSYAYATCAMNDAAFVSQQVPTSMVAGQTYSVSLTFKNTGNTTWTSATLYRLGSQNPQDTLMWGANRTSLSADVAPGATATFSFAVQAPATAGTYNFQRRMVQDRVEWFGDLSSAVTVHISPKTPSKLIGAYYGSPGSINFRVSGGCGVHGCGWPSHLLPHPVLGKYDSGASSTINYFLDRAAALGIDFLVLDESNGMHYGAPPLESDLLAFLDITDQRIRSGIPTPHITVMSPMPGTNGGAADDNDWIWNNLVHKNGVPRPSWLWLEGRPFWGVYSASPFRTDFSDSRYFIRYIANSANNECHQAQKDLGTVWCWATVGESNPLYSAQSEEVTIQNGYSNVVTCYDYWGFTEPDPRCFTTGFTSDYYNKQWDTAVSSNPQIIVITNFGGGAQVEGGQIEARTDFGTLYEDITRNRAQAWKGSLVPAPAIGP